MTRDDTTVDVADELEKLHASARRLGDEESSLQLVMERPRPPPGVAAMVQPLLTGIVETLGGTDIALHYWIDGRIHRAGLNGDSRPLAGLKALRAET